MPAAPTSAAPIRLAVAPSLLDDTGRRLVVSTAATSTRLASHAAGPRPTPAIGDPACTAAYASAQHQLAGLITAAVAQARALAGGLTVAAALYRVLDTGGDDVGAETLAELGPVQGDRSPVEPPLPPRAAA